MTFHKTTLILTAIVLAAAQVAVGQSGGGPTNCREIVVVDDGREVRLLSEASGARDDNNGGNPTLGANGIISLIGDNGTGTPNYMVYGFDLSEHAGVTLSSDAIVTIAAGIGYSPTAGNTDDIITVSELAITNSGWVEGGGAISLADNPADDGSVSFLNRVQFSGSGTSEPWLDFSGNAVENLLGAMTPVATRPGYNISDPLGTEYTLIIPQATAQRWIDDGLAGLVFSATDPDPINGDGWSRFNISENVTISFQTTVGDINLDGSVDFLDISPFIAILSANDFLAEADINKDGVVSFLDIAPFILLLSV